jgi:glycosyltransferase involved in cell wall biosynthesis
MAVSYVTRYALQKRYPAGKSTFSTWFSDVDLPNSAFVEKPRIFDKKSDAFNLVLVGSLEQLYKAPDKYQAELEARVRLLNLQQQICFAGQVPSGHAIRSYLDKADLFVLPSRTEGLPRALIEAMARALPCIGSAVGGIPELLIDDDLVTPGCVDDLAEKIRQVVTDVNRISAMSKRNLQKSIVYKDDFLHAKRLEFYNYIRGETEKWARSVQK